MIHLITLSGNSSRFISKGYPHKSLVKVNGKSAIDIFVDGFTDFNDYKSIFLCRSQDLESTPLKNEILKKCPLAKVLGIEKNNLGPVYSISKVFDQIQDSTPITITYIDSVQKDSLKSIKDTFEECDGGILVHGFDNPHWRSNKYYCLVRHDEDMRCTEVSEKYNFNNFDFNDAHGCCGSNGTYYIKDSSLMKEYFLKLMKDKKTVNGEYYVTQIFQEMISDGLNVKVKYTPYVSFGIPEDVEDYIFWENWFESVGR